MKKWIKGCGIGCGSAVILFAVVGVIAWKSSGIGKASSETTETLAKAKALGLPLLASDLQRKPPLKPEENAYTILEKSLSGLDNDIEGANAQGEFQRALDRQAPPQEIMQLMQRLGSFPQQAEQFASAPHCDFLYDWDNLPYEIHFKQISYAKNFSRFLCGRATTEAQLGQIQPALKDLRLAQRIGPLLRETPVLMHSLIAIPCDVNVAITYEQMISLFSDDSVKLAMIQNELDAWNQPVSVRSIIPGEFYLTLVRGRNAPSPLSVIDPSTFPPSDKLERSGEPRGFIQRGLVTRALQRWISLVEFLKKNPTDLELKEYWANLNQNDSFQYSEANEILSRSYLDAIMTENAKRSCLRGLVASLLYRNSQGRFPDSLAEAGYRELDPFTDKPLKLAMMNGKFRVYSIGPDGVDNQGQKKSEMKESKTPDQFDVVASCPVK